MDDVSIPIVDVAVNDLAAKSLNPGLFVYEPSESVEEAIDGLSERIRQGALFIGSALLEIAEAIREHTLANQREEE